MALTKEEKEQFLLPKEQRDAIREERRRKYRSKKNRKRYTSKAKVANTVAERLRLLLQVESGVLDPDELPKGFDGWVNEMLSLEEHMNIVQIKKALNGDSKAYELIMDRAHGKPKQEIEQNTNNNISIAPIEWINSLETNDVKGNLTDGKDDAEEAQVVDE